MSFVFALIGSLASTIRAIALNLPVTAPVAEDDGGSGYITSPDKAIITGDVLANDHDPDGDLMFVETFLASSTTGLVSYLTAGSLDTSFDHDGLVNTETDGDYDEGNAMALQSDGKIIVVGDPGFTIARYQPDGSLDPTFDGDGIVVTRSNDVAGAQDVAIQPDGKIVVAGATWYDIGDNGDLDFAVARYLPDGSLDSGFDSDGMVITDLGSDTDRAYAVALQPDGKIVVAGSSNNNFVVIRYLPGGSLDTSFSGDGIVRTDFGQDEHAYALALQPDGKIVVAGSSGIDYTEGDFALARYKSNGALDTSFSTDGKVTTNFSVYDNAFALALQNDGKIVAVGYANDNEEGNIAVARFNTNGSLDTDFNEDGMLTTDFMDYFSYTGDTLDAAHAVAIQAEGRIVVAGTVARRVGLNTEYYFALVRYNPDGNLDLSFGAQGKVATKFFYSNPLGYDVANDIALQADNMIVAAGVTSSYYADDTDFALARYNSGGRFLYDPNGQYDGLVPGQNAYDTFTYVVSDNLETDTATVTITIRNLAKVYLPVVARP